MYVCMYVCMYVYIYIYIYMYVCVCEYIYSNDGINNTPFLRYSEFHAVGYATIFSGIYDFQTQS